MYKCKECGTEFETKPDYCDCGNDTFDEILPKTTTTKNDVTNVTKLNKDNEEIKNIDESKIQEEVIKKVENKTITPKYDYSRLKQFFDPISTTIFCVCVILSILIVLFVGNSLIKEDNLDPSKKVESSINTNIPDIDKLWNNTPPVYKEEAKVVETQNEPQISNEVSQTPLKVEPKKVEKTQPLLTQPKANKQIQKQQPKLQKAQASKQTTKTQVSKNVQNSAQAKQEMNNYKLSLRNRMASRIDFARVVGDGDCIVAFKVDSTGKLVNRSFAKQSDNDSLNDVVYNAVMSLPTFSAPPKSYKGEFLHLRVKMYSGNFEVYLY